jgi:hypothetical protein
MGTYLPKLVRILLLKNTVLTHMVYHIHLKTIQNIVWTLGILAITYIVAFGMMELDSENQAELIRTVNILLLWTPKAQIYHRMYIPSYLEVNRLDMDLQVF